MPKAGDIWRSSQNTAEPAIVFYFKTEVVSGGEKSSVKHGFRL